MPLPIAAGLAVGGSIVAGGLLSQGMSTFVSPWLEPATYDFRLRAWYGRPIMMPTPEQVISAWNKGALEPSQVRSQLREHGIDLSPDWATSTDYVSQDWPRGNWNRTIRSTYVRIPPDTVMRYYHLDIMGFDVADEELLRSGLRLNDTRLAVLQPHLVPTIPTCLDARNRGFINDVTLTQYLKANGATRANEREVWEKLRFNWPTPTDLIPFAVKDIWAQQVVDRFQYDAEFPDVFQTFMERQGMGWKPSDLDVPVPANFDITWPRAYWRAHWQMMSPTMAGHAVNFLRPDLADPTKSRRPDIPPFTEQDFDLVLKIADYPPIIRQWLRGLSYLPLTRVDIKRMRKLGVIEPPEAVQLYRDLGYDQTNAERMAQSTEEDIEQSKTSRERARLETIVRNLFLNCMMTKDEFARSIFALRRPTAAKRAAYLAQGEAAQTAQANANPDVMLLVNTLEAQRNLNDVKKTVSAIRKAAHSGLISMGEAKNLLSQAGLNGECIGGIIDNWTRSAKMVVKLPSVANILKYFIRGAMTADEASYRLQQLGYSNQDVGRMLALAAQDAALQAAKENERLANTARKQQKAQEAILKEARAARNAVIADLNRSATKADILRVYRKGLIDRYEAYTAMIARGVLPREANIFLNEAQRNGTSQSEPPA